MPSSSIGGGISCLAVVKLMAEERVRNFVAGRLFEHILKIVRACKRVYKLRLYVRKRDVFRYYARGMYTFELLSLQESSNCGASWIAARRFNEIQWAFVVSVVIITDSFSTCAFAKRLCTQRWYSAQHTESG